MSLLGLISILAVADWVSLGWTQESPNQIQNYSFEHDANTDGLADKQEV